MFILLSASFSASFSACVNGNFCILIAWQANCCRSCGSRCCFFMPSWLLLSQHFGRFSRSPRLSLPICWPIHLAKDCARGCVCWFEKQKSDAKKSRCSNNKCLFCYRLPPVSGKCDEMRAEGAERRRSGISLLLSSTCAGSHVPGISGRRCPRKTSLCPGLEPAKWFGTIYWKLSCECVHIPPNDLWAKIGEMCGRRRPGNCWRNCHTNIITAKNIGFLLTIDCGSQPRKAIRGLAGNQQWGEACFRQRLLNICLKLGDAWKFLVPKN